MSDYVNETELAIGMGVPPIPGDTGTTEAGVEELSLLEGVRGFAVAADG
ncbi:MAG TPA: hypothetical protein VHO69_14940 [Phototrophicaceae bacterium]|nr:hypothetical protein [Phototrophicaceae bacterium]